MIEGVPARIGLVVLAPAGTGERIEEHGIKDLLNRVIWGLGAIVEEEQSPIRIWPPQLSSHGFPAVFHRLVHRNEPDGEPSHWILVAGATPSRPRAVLLGLGLWTEEPTTIGRLAMEPRDWTLSLHVQSLETDPLEVNAPPEQQTAPSAPEVPQGESTPIPVDGGEPERVGESATHGSESVNNQPPAAESSPAVPQETESMHTVQAWEANEAPSHPPDNNQHS